MNNFLRKTPISGHFGLFAKIDFLIELYLFVTITQNTKFGTKYETIIVFT